MTRPDFQAEAEMFSNVRKLGWRRAPMKYRRFANLALAVKCAVEDMDDAPSQIIIRTESEDFTGSAIRTLYDSESFPLDRKALPAATPAKS